MSINTQNTEKLDKPKTRSSDRVREHLANERTYLAWMRSGIALMGFGVLIVRLRILRPPLAPQAPGNGWRLGLAFALVGLLTVLFSTQHYLTVGRDIENDSYEPADRLVILSSLAIVLLGIGVIYYVFSIPFNSLNTVIAD